jgi:hypothetical protein
MHDETPQEEPLSKKAKSMIRMREVLQEHNLLQVVERPKRPTHRVDGVGGMFQIAIGKRWWVPDGETIEDAVKRQQKPFREMRVDMARLKAWREKQLNDGVEDLTQQELEIQATLESERFYDADGKLLKSSEITPQMRLNKFLSARTAALYQASFDLATGLYVEKETKGGNKRIYRTAPESSTLKYLLDQLHGKPTTPRGRPVSASQIPDNDDLEVREI